MFSLLQSKSGFRFFLSQKALRENVTRSLHLQTKNQNQSRWSILHNKKKFPSSSEYSSNLLWKLTYCYKQFEDKTKKDNNIVYPIFEHRQRREYGSNNYNSDGNESSKNSQERFSYFRSLFSFLLGTGVLTCAVSIAHVYSSDKGFIYEDYYTQAEQTRMKLNPFERILYFLKRFRSDESLLPEFERFNWISLGINEEFYVLRPFEWSHELISKDVYLIAPTDSRLLNTLDRVSLKVTFCRGGCDHDKLVQKYKETGFHVNDSGWQQESTDPKVENYSAIINHETRPIRLFVRTIHYNFQTVVFEFQSSMKDWEENWEKYGKEMTVHFAMRANEMVPIPENRIPRPKRKRQIEIPQPEIPQLTPEQMHRRAKEEYEKQLLRESELEREQDFSYLDNRKLS